MFIILLSLIFLRPFISSLAYPYLNFLYSLILLAFLAVWLLLKRFAVDKIQKLKLPLLLFCLSITLSLLFSKDRVQSFAEIYKYLSGVFLFLIGLSLAKKDKLVAVRVIVGAGVIISILALYQYFFGFRHILDYLARKNITDPFVLDYVSTKRVFFPFVTPNILGGYLAMILLLALTDKYKAWIIIPIFAALLLTKSLGALASLLAGLVIYFQLRGKLKIKRIFLLLLVASAICVVFIIRTQTIKQHIQPLFSTLSRFNYWEQALEVIASSPFAGVGPGNFNLSHSRYAHNSYLQVWAELGILGLVSFLWIVFLVIKTGLENSKNNYLICGLLSSVTVFLLHNVVDFSFFLPEVALIWWVILGMALD